MFQIIKLLQLSATQTSEKCNLFEIRNIARTCHRSICSRFEKLGHIVKLFQRLKNEKSTLEKLVQRNSPNSIYPPSKTIKTKDTHARPQT